MRLGGKVALVTGAAMGMGEAFARRLAREGASVVLTDIAIDAAEAVTRQIRTEGGRSAFVPLDVADPNAWQRAIRFTQDTYGRLDVLVNNAGIGVASTIVDCTIEDWTRTMSVNLTGVFLGCRAAIPLMREGGGGSIINVSSIFGIVSDQLCAAYSASKGGVRSLTKSSALHCAVEKTGVRVNSVHPGFVKTPLVENGMASMPPELSAAYDARTVQRVPMGRMGTPQDIEGVVVFLASDDSVFMTGAELVIDGGYMSH